MADKQSALVSDDEDDWLLEILKETQSNAVNNAAKIRNQCASSSSASSSTAHSAHSTASTASVPKPKPKFDDRHSVAPTDGSRDQKPCRTTRQPRYILPEVVFKLSCARLAGIVLNHAISVISTLIGSGPTVFKIGATRDPQRRWSGQQWSYKFHSDLYQQMIVLIEVQNSQACGFAEAALIKHFKGRPGCRNDADGGEGLPDNLNVTHYVYVAYRHLESPLAVPPTA